MNNQLDLQVDTDPMSDADIEFEAGIKFEADIEFDRMPVWVVDPASGDDEPSVGSRWWTALAAVTVVLGLVTAAIFDVALTDDAWLAVADSEEPTEVDFGVDARRQPTYVEEFVSHREEFEVHLAEFEMHLAEFDVHLLEFETQVARSSGDDGVLPAHLEEFEDRMAVQRTPHLVNSHQLTRPDHLPSPSTPMWHFADVQIDRNGNDRSDQQEGDHHGEWISRDSGVALGS